MMNINKILPRLYVGSCPQTADDVGHLAQLGVSAVLNLQTDDDLQYWQIDWPAMQGAYDRARIELRRQPIEDFNVDELRIRLPACVATLAELMRADYTALVHCNAGINRSPSTVIAYLHWIENWELPQALQHVMASRACDPYVEAIEQATAERRAD